MIDWSKCREFSRVEFDDPNHPGSGEEFNEYSFSLLLNLRRVTHWPIITHARVGGAVDVDGSHGHAKNSRHLLRMGASALDWHFDTNAHPREQVHAVIQSGFTGIGIYYDWKWNGKKLPVGFHTDTRPKNQTQIWTRRYGRSYIYLLD